LPDAIISKTVNYYCGILWSTTNDLKKMLSLLKCLDLVFPKLMVSSFLQRPARHQLPASARLADDCSDFCESTAALVVVHRFEDNADDIPCPLEPVNWQIAGQLTEGGTAAHVETDGLQITGLAPFAGAVFLVG
jgi:hypothetical protein